MAIAITTEKLPNGAVGFDYNFQLHAETMPPDTSLIWSCGNEIPPDLSLDPNTGVLSGLCRKTYLGSLTFWVEDKNTKEKDHRVLLLSITPHVAATNTICVAACDNELSIIVYEISASYQLAHILSGNNNSVDIRVSIAQGDYIQPVTINGVTSNIKGDYLVTIPKGSYTLLAVGINWGGPFKFAVALNDQSLTGDQIGINDVNVVWEASTGLIN